MSSVLTKQYYFFDLTLHNNPDKSVTMIFPEKSSTPILPNKIVTPLRFHPDHCLTSILH